jgi:hypothetical protein
MRHLPRVAAPPAAAAALAILASGCGGSATSPTAATTTAQPASTTHSPATTSATAQASPGALQAEANAAAAGDIPDNQVFLLFKNAGSRYSMKYPEGWAQRGSGAHVTFRDKNNIVRVIVRHGPVLNIDSVRRELRVSKGVTIVSAPTRIALAGSPALKVVYSTESAPNQVTGKRVKLVVDRYYLWKSGRIAIVDLGTPVGVDNVDAYRMMIESFRWS